MSKRWLRNASEWVEILMQSKTDSKRLPCHHQQKQCATVAFVSIAMQQLLCKIIRWPIAVLRLKTHSFRMENKNTSLWWRISFFFSMTWAILTTDGHSSLCLLYHLISFDGSSWSHSLSTLIQWSGNTSSARIIESPDGRGGLIHTITFADQTCGSRKVSWWQLIKWLNWRTVFLV